MLKDKNGKANEGETIWSILLSRVKGILRGRCNGYAMKTAAETQRLFFASRKPDWADSHSDCFNKLHVGATMEKRLNDARAAKGREKWPGLPIDTKQKSLVQRKTAWNQGFSLVGEDGFEPSKRRRNRFTVCPHWPLGNSPIFKQMELVDGFEPPTCWLQISCSTSWATPAWKSACQLHILLYAP